jgi:hypothetical protein
MSSSSEGRGIRGSANHTRIHMLPRYHTLLTWIFFALLALVILWSFIAGVVPGLA